MRLTRLSDLPRWADFRKVAIDLETCDPHLTDLGPGVRREGFIAGISFCCGDQDGPAFYLPIRHDSGNYADPRQVLHYLYDQAKYFRGEIVGANLQYDLDWLAEEGIKFQPSFFRDVQISGPLLDQPTMSLKVDKQGRKFYGEDFHRMSLDAQAKRLGMSGKDEDQLVKWAESKGLDPKKDLWKAPAGIVEQYAIQDVRLPLALLEKHEPEIDAQGIREVYDMECELLPVLLKMRRRGVRVDLSKLEQIDATALHLETLAMREVSRISGVTLEISDTNKTAALAKALLADGVDVPMTKKSGKRSVTAPWLQALNTPLSDAILKAKKWNKVRTTFCNSVRRHAVNGRIHTTFHQLRQERDDGDIKGAEFGRLSSSNPNLQQQPARDPEIGSLWRSIYQPDEGGKWACLDFSSQEPRLIIHYAEKVGCPGGSFAADACRSNPSWDNHSMVASMMYDDFCEEDLHGDDKEKRKYAKTIRDNGKTIGLGLCYGMGGGKLCRKLDLPTVLVVRDLSSRKYRVLPADCPEARTLRRKSAPYEVAGPEGRALLDRFNERVPYIKNLARKAMKRAENIGYITTILGRRCRFPVHPRTGEVEFSYKALNRLIQGSAADQTKRSMVQADKAGVRMQLQVHDEIDLTIWSIDEAKELERIMVNAVPLNVPTRTDIEVGPDWGHITQVG